MSQTPHNDIVSVAEVPGAMQADMLRGMLEAQGIDVMLSEESAARAIGISLPGLGIVHIMVRAEQAEAAKKIIEEFDSGSMENEELSTDTDETE
jgi:hypothetical protein